MERDITISRDYFLTLLRRAELHDSDDETLVTIPKREHDSLLQHMREYKALRSALIAGGTTTQTLEILIKTSNPVAPLQERKTYTDTPITIPGTPKSQNSCHTEHKCLSSRDSTSHPQTRTGSPVNLSTFGRFGQYESEDQGVFLKVEKKDTSQYRTIVLYPIPSFASIADILDVVKGGMIFNVFIYAQRRNAYVTFVWSNAANDFMSFAKTTNIYIKGKRVTAGWDHRQRHISNYFMNCMRYNGATRNLLIRFPRCDITAETIRADLEHIHHLEVVYVQFENGHAWISTNSIQAAITARSCMMSQLKYKISKIEFFADECDQPLPKRKAYPKANADMTRKIPHSRPLVLSNRYESLSCDDELQNHEESDTICGSLSESSLND